MPDAFYMIRLRLQARTLAVLAQRRGLPPRSDDAGYVIHSFLRELFGDMAPSPFSIEREEGKLVEVLGYADVRAVELREYAGAFADPFHFSGVVWESMADKPMPDRWQAGQRLGFKTRICPVVRRAKPGPRGEQAGREMDVFLANVELAGTEPLDRYSTYLQWLGAALARSGGALLARGSVDAFRLRRLVRRDKLGKPTTVPPVRSNDHGSSGRPDVTIRGELTVVDPLAFAHLLRRGIGRHRAFGFGMILLRPPGNT